MAEKLSVLEPKVSKNLNWAVDIENLLGYYDACVTYLQYFCTREVKKIV